MRFFSPPSAIHRPSAPPKLKFYPTEPKKGTKKIPFPSGPYTLPQPTNNPPPHIASPPNNPTNISPQRKGKPARHFVCSQLRSIAPSLSPRPEFTSTWRTSMRPGIRTLTWRYVVVVASGPTLVPQASTLRTVVYLAVSLPQ
ncbi:hypothetical protein VN97_g8621 [Penicillium thymicola]|uniref:Uncharacterized protein n=1 Tax=Penicillium thymicola TaxID=293382 RepID=A0AAI9TCF3_PENTH|nr:hypothetical protein VN97_g8621 [Penicillium thymicola]